MCSINHQMSKDKIKQVIPLHSTYKMVLVDGVSTVPHKYCRKRLACFNFLQGFIGMLPFGFWFSSRHNEMGPKVMGL